MNELPRRTDGKRLLAQRSSLDKKKRLGVSARTRKRIMKGKLKEITQITRSPSKLARQSGKSDLDNQVVLIVTVPCQTLKKGSLP